MTEEDKARAARIAKLNDELRGNVAMPGKDRVFVTPGIRELVGTMPALDTFRKLTDLFLIVRTYDRFSEDNDPYGERDFGAFDFEGVRCFWKIDYYDLALEYGSGDASDPEVTCRVLTILRADEY